MRDLLISAYELVHPVVEIPAVRERLRFLDAHFAPLTASFSLVIALVMWANI